MPKNNQNNHPQKNNTCIGVTNVIRYTPHGQMTLKGEHFVVEQAKTKYYLVSGDALPEVFIRVTQARELLDTGQAETVAEAAERVGISRSAYYKYKNSVMSFQSVGAGRIVTFQIMLRHQMGVLSAVLGVFSGTGANILTINQGIPTNGAAPVTITVDTVDLEMSTEDLLASLRKTDGVISATVVSG